MYSELFSLNNKVVVITGGYGYLGKSISAGLAEAGATVLVAGRDKEKFQSTFSDKAHLSISFTEMDISDNASIKRSFASVVQEYGHIDVLINNAFFSRGNDPENISDEDWQYSIDGSLNSVYRTIREVLPYMKKQGKGRIINVSSMYGMVSPDFSVYEDIPQFLNPPQYGAAKAGVIQLTKYMASLLGKFNINVNSISPGPFPSKAVQENKVFIDRLKKKNPLGRIGVPDDLKGPFVFLASDASEYVTGQNLAVDGGWTSW